MDIFMYLGALVMLVYIGIWIRSLLPKKPTVVPDGIIEYAGSPKSVSMYPPSNVNGVKVH